MKKFLKSVAVLAVAPFVTTAGAQEPESDLVADDIVYEAGAIEVVRPAGEVGSALERAKPVEPSNVGAPKFAVTTKNRKFIFAVGGQIVPVMGYDIGNNLYAQDDAGINFVTGDIPVPALAGHKGDFFINPINGYVDFSVVAFSGTRNQLTGYVKIGTNGINSTIKLKRAYLTWRNFQAGAITTIMKDGLAAQPPTIDPQGPGGDVAGMAYSLAYVSPSYDGFRFAVGLEKPTFNSSNGVYLGEDFRSHYGHQVDASVDELFPDVPMWIEYQASKQNRVRLSGVLRSFAYQDMVQKKRRHLLGWGAMLSGNFSFWQPLTFNFQGVCGRGIANYIQDLAGRPLSFTPKSDELGRMEANPMLGLVFGASLNATSRLQFNVVGSYTRIWNVGDYATVDDKLVADANGVEVMTAGAPNFHYSAYLAVNCFYNFTSYLSWGIEYLYGHRTTWNLGGANDSRVQTQLCFSF